MMFLGKASGRVVSPLVPMDKRILVPLMGLLLSGCANLPFKNPLVIFTFGPILTVYAGEKNDVREINAYGPEASQQAIASATEAIHIEIPSKQPSASADGPKGDQNGEQRRNKNLW